MKYFILTALTALITGGAMIGGAEAQTQEIKTHGVHHVGLAVKDLQTTLRFFKDALDFKEVGGKPDYPSVFVSDGTIMVTLWQADEGAATFDRKKNIGLHHLAFKLGSFEDLDAMHKKIKDWPGVEIEFSPEDVGEGPAKHMIFYEPGGIRLEFIVVPES